MTDKLRERYEGQFLDALDLPEGTLVPVEVEAIALPYSEKDARGKVIDLAILSFKGKTKRFILGKTSYKIMKAMFGGDHRQWIGKTIHIQRRYLDAARGFGVNNTLAIRVIPPAGTPILRSAANYMGQPHPYAEKGQPARKPPTKHDAELTQWLTAVSALASLAECEEFGPTLETCPATIRAQVDEAFAKQQEKLRGGSDASA